MTDDSPQLDIKRFVYRTVLLGGLGQFILFFALYVGVDARISDGLFALSSGVAGSAVWWALFARYADASYQRLLTHSSEKQQKVFEAALDTQRALLESDVRHRNTLREKNVPTGV